MTSLMADLWRMFLLAVVRPRAREKWTKGMMTADVLAAVAEDEHEQAKKIADDVGMEAALRAVERFEQQEAVAASRRLAEAEARHRARAYREWEDWAMNDAMAVTPNGPRVRCVLTGVLVLPNDSTVQGSRRDAFMDWQPGCAGDPHCTVRVVRGDESSHGCEADSQAADGAAGRSGTGTLPSTEGSTEGVTETAVALGNCQSSVADTGAGTSAHTLPVCPDDVSTTGPQAFVLAMNSDMPAIDLDTPPC